MNPLFSSIIVLMMIMTAIVIVINTTTPAIDSSKAYVNVKDAERVLKFIDDYMREVSEEGHGSGRVFQFLGEGEFETLPGEDALQIKTESNANFLDYFSRRIVGNMIYISGNDVKCSDDGNLNMENTFIKVVFNKTAVATPNSFLNTSDNIVSMTEKTSGNTITFLNSTVIIDNDITSANGTGYSELLKTGAGLPSCSVHFYVNATKIDYDIYYMLYAGADFLVMEVRNVKNK